MTSEPAADQPSPLPWDTLEPETQHAIVDIAEALDDDAPAERLKGKKRGFLKTAAALLTGGVIGGGARQAFIDSAAAADSSSGSVGIAGGAVDVYLDELRDPGGDVVGDFDDTGAVDWQGRGFTNLGAVSAEEVARPVGGEVAYTDAAGQSIAHSTWDPVAFDTVRLDQRGEWDDANNEFVLANDGVYLAEAQVYWDSISTAGTFRVKLFKNGASFGAVQDELELAAGESGTCGPSVALFDAVAGDTIQVGAWHDGDSTGETIMGHASANGFRLIRLG